MNTYTATAYFSGAKENPHIVEFKAAGDGVASAAAQMSGIWLDYKFANLIKGCPMIGKPIVQRKTN